MHADARTGPLLISVAAALAFSVPPLSLAYAQDRGATAVGPGDRAAPPVARRPAESVTEPLGERERQVLQLVAVGLSNREIAAQLVISAGTAETHTASIYRKLDVGNRTRAVARARELGLLDA